MKGGIGWEGGGGTSNEELEHTACHRVRVIKVSLVALLKKIPVQPWEVLLIGVATGRFLNLQGNKFMNI